MSVLRKIVIVIVLFTYGNTLKRHKKWFEKGKYNRVKKKMDSELMSITMSSWCHNENDSAIFGHHYFPLYFFEKYFSVNVEIEKSFRVIKPQYATYILFMIN